MQPGPARGDSASIDVTVTSAMTARIKGKVIHEAYSTIAFVEHTEQICRQLLEPHLRPGEDAVGYRIELLHRAPAPVGARLTITATVADVGPRKLVCEVVARNGTRMVARGSFEQRVVDAASFEERIAQGEASTVH